jgi:hypothetical protein
MSRAALLERDPDLARMFALASTLGAEMAIAAADIKYLLSTTAGAAGYSTAQANPNNSLGKYASTTQVVDNVTLNIFDVITGDENAASTVDYRCLFVLNDHATLTLFSAVLWISAEVASGASVAIGLEAAAPVPKGQAGAQAVTIANELTAPAGVAFTAPTTKAGGLALGDIPAGYVRPFWIRRTAANTAAVDADGATWSVGGDSSA